MKYGIFSGTYLKEDAMWLESVEGVDATYDRMGTIANERPGKYFIFSSDKRKAVASIDTTGLTTLGNQQRENTSESRLDRQGSLSMALKVLRKHRKEMHTKEIAEDILGEFHVRVNKRGLGTQLWRHIKNHPDSPFYKSKRTSNTYGLKERQLTATVSH
jgi:hypothetical protein